MHEFGTSAVIEQEGIKATVKAYAEGKLDGEMKKPPTKTPDSEIRYAPSFVHGCCAHGAQHPYTSSTISAFFHKDQPNGRPSRRIQNALAALEATELQLVEADDGL
jgi:hypothetical protein